MTNAKKAVKKQLRHLKEVSSAHGLTRKETKRLKKAVVAKRARITVF